MGKHDTLMERILSGRSDANRAFNDMCRLLERLGFGLRIRGSHHIYKKEGIEQRINLQNRRGKVDSYQVQQVRKTVQQHNLGDQ